ncbi:hypothetical protein BP6252_00380 [Coleophoma cylindrospora]|uniref:Uncharacterized protein n=1 Tax=Coleophoma cylindrospora TaxID=1849047 RepID=A0A3D8SRC4_9HELO|nr:hypothetical protein BP6252_00380 [Coleophoma cylindrospora]
MGLRNYFQTSIKAAASSRPDPNSVTAEKSPENDIALRPGAFSTDSSSVQSTTNPRHMSVDDIKHQVILNYLWQKQRGLMWITDTTGQNEGVMVRKNRTEYLCRPTNLSLSPFAEAMSLLNVQAAMTVNSSVVEPFLNWSPSAVDIPLLNGLRIQILPSLAELPRARRHQYAAFIRKEAILVVWEDDPTLLYNRVKTIEDGLLQTVWKTGASEKAVVQASVSEVDAESGTGVVEERPIMYINTIMASFSICLLTVLLGLGWAQMALEVLVEGSWISLAYLAMIPITSFLALFFCNIVVGVVSQLFGPIQQMAKNSRFYSATPPPRLFDSVLPHVTIQCPVYKEGLSAVIEPTIKSIKKAISTYELQGGSANIFVNDDGLQIISEEDREARINFYADNGIGWTARPANGQDGYIRKGKFKKASNMNFGLALSNSVEDKLKAIVRPTGWSQVDEVDAFEKCLQETLQENPRAWADGNIRIGDYILLIDSDTEVPEDCLLDAAGEMDQSPEVGIIQFSSGVMQVSHNFFENGITFFTNLVYTAIRYCVSNGTVAAFVGHNAILRWSAVQAVAFDDEDGVERFWSESCVSEDFDMALRLQLAGYVIRMAAWAGDGFKEGVSLTVYDELTRWQKYAYGCNELLFNPIRTWGWKGPLTPLFRRFLVSNIDIASKLGIIAYIGTYYAIGAAWIFTVVNYVFIGLWNGYLDKVYMDSWQIWVAITVVFSLAGNVGLAVLRHRSGEKDLLSALFENFKWCIMFAIFFGGLSLHMSQALLCHMFEIDMSWGATSKEVEFSNFFMEVPKVLKSFKYSFIASFLGIAVIIIMAFGTFIPWSYNITEFVAIFPLAIMCASHLLLPIALNPEMMTFSW